MARSPDYERAFGEHGCCGLRLWYTPWADNPDWLNCKVEYFDALGRVTRTAEGKVCVSDVLKGAMHSALDWADAQALATVEWLKVTEANGPTFPQFPGATPRPWRSDHSPMDTHKADAERWHIVAGGTVVASGLLPDDARLICAHVNSTVGLPDGTDDVADEVQA